MAIWCLANLIVINGIGIGTWIDLLLSIIAPLLTPLALILATLGLFISRYPNDFVFGCVCWGTYLGTYALSIILIIYIRRFLPIQTENICPKCGYDVRVTPIRCSECGTSIIGK
jgi:hypothetical protein